MTELELFAYAIVFATGLCAALWLTLAGCIVFSVWEWVRGKYGAR